MVYHSPGSGKYHINVVMPSTRPDIKIDATHKKAASILLFTTTKNQVCSVKIDMLH